MAKIIKITPDTEDCSVFHFRYMAGPMTIYACSMYIEQLEEILDKDDYEELREKRELRVVIKRFWKEEKNGRRD